MLRPASFGLNQIGSRVLTASRSLKVHSPSEVLRICRAQACTMVAARLHSNEDMYGGVIVEPSSLPTDPQEFRAALHVALEEWHAAGKRGIWLKVPVDKASLIAPAIEGSFKFHHAEEGYVMLTRWLPEEPSTLPPNASHQVGVGACVINAQGQVLVVQERNGPLKGKQVWKIPTGLVHAGEDLCDAAEREVWEETGVQCKFEGMLAVRQAHGFAFGKSDLFFVCALRPQAGQDNLQPQEAEIVAVQWMDWQEYCQQAFLQQPLHAEIAECCAAYARGEYKGFAAARLQSSVTRPREDLLMWGQGRGQQGVQPQGQQQQQQQQQQQAAL